MSNKMQFFFSSLDFAANKDRVFTLLIKEGLNRHIGDFCAKNTALQGGVVRFVIFSLHVA